MLSVRFLNILLKKYGCRIISPHEHALITLAAIIAQQAHVGTSVTNPFCRTPVDLASGFATLSHMAERGITVGIGAGSSTSDMMRKRGRVSMLREMILFLKEMFAGRKANAGGFSQAR